MEEVGGWEYRKVVESEGEFGRVIGTEGRIYKDRDKTKSPFFVPLMPTVARGGQVLNLRKTS